MNKKFNDSVKSLVNVGNITYSKDIKKMLDEGKIAQEDITAIIQRMLNKDFGSITGERARRFGNHMDLGDKDVYGVYDNIVLYYDASRDRLNVVTDNEFTHYYIVDWPEEERKGFNERYNPQLRKIGPKMPEDPAKYPEWKETMLKEQRILTEGQSREAMRLAQKELEETSKDDDVYDLKNFARLGWKVTSVEDYTDFIERFDRLVGRDKRMNLINLAKQYNIPVKRLYAVIMYYHDVQHKPMAFGYDYVMKNLGERRKLGIVASDTKEK